MNFQPITIQHFQVMIDKGFVFDHDHPGGEIVLRRRHEKDDQLSIKVYTSIPKGEDVCREAGADAIRVVLVRRDPNYGEERGVGKAKRVNRVGAPEDVVGRALDRARELWKKGNRP